MTVASRRSALSALAAVGLLVVVAAGTGATRPTLRAGDTGDAHWLLDAAASVVAIAALAAAAVVVYALWPGGPRRRRHPDELELVYEPPPVPWWEKALALALPLLLVAVVFGLLVANSRHTGRPGVTPVLPPSAAPTQTRPPGVPPPTGAAPVLDGWIVATVVAGALVATAATMVWRRRRQGGAVAGRATRERQRDAVRGVEESLEALEAEPDSRRAVIAAYARMEGWLARAGTVRAPWEAPFEYLDRVLVELGAPAAIAARLTELFERAKFAPHPVGDAMKRSALDALVELRDQLGRAA